MKVKYPAFCVMFLRICRPLKVLVIPGGNGLQPSCREHTMTSQPDYRDTVFLPATAFPMRGDLPKRLQRFR